MKVVYSPWFDPSLNLAIESWLLDRNDLTGKEVLFFYRNRPSVIIGRSQNPWVECNLNRMAADGISFFRRESGGGAVYHDRGNLNFSFMTDKNRMIKEERTDIVVQALKSLGIGAVKGERNDIYIGERKISGSAGRYGAARALHHGTLLIQADLSALVNYLHIFKDQLSVSNSKSIPSIRSKVTNISEFDKSIQFSDICHAIVKQTSDFLGSPVEEQTLDQSSIKGVDEIESKRNELTSWNWLFGKTPSFAATAPLTANGKRYESLLSVKKGVIRKISCIGPPLDERIQFLLENRFSGQPFDVLDNLEKTEAGMVVIERV